MMCGNLTVITACIVPLNSLHLEVTYARLQAGGLTAFLVQSTNIYVKQAMKVGNINSVQL